MRDKVCNFCGNRHHRQRTVQYVYRRDDQYFIVNNVPCEQCEYCGEQYFEAEVLKKIEEGFEAIYSGGKKAARELQVPVEEFSECK